MFSLVSSESEWKLRVFYAQIRQATVLRYFVSGGYIDGDAKISFYDIQFHAQYFLRARATKSAKKIDFSQSLHIF